MQYVSEFAPAACRPNASMRTFVTVYLGLSSGNPFATTATGGSYWTATIPSSTFYPHTPSSTGQTSAQYVVGKCEAGSDFDYVYGQVLVGGTIIQVYIYNEFCTAVSYPMGNVRSSDLR